MTDPVLNLMHQRLLELVSEVINLRQENESLRAAAERAARAMNDYGNIANWPPDMPMEYAEAINDLRAALWSDDG